MKLPSTDCGMFGSACTGGVAWEPEQQSVKTRTSSFHDLIVQRKVVYGKWKRGHPV